MTTAKQMPGHVNAAYRDAAENIIFLKRQQWLATNYVLLLYAAIFLISAYYFSRTDVARNWLGVLTRLFSTGGFCTYFKVQLRNLQIAWTGFTAPTSAERSVLDWMCNGSQKHIGMKLKFTLASWLSHWSELS